jgi:hypothetical protein
MVYLHSKYIEIGVKKVEGVNFENQTLLLLAIVLSVLLRYTDSECPFGIFKLFTKIAKYRNNQDGVRLTGVFLSEI